MPEPGLRIPTPPPSGFGPETGEAGVAAGLSVLKELASLPYENLSKIVAARPGKGGAIGLANAAAREKALCRNLDWITARRNSGEGATCFGLTFALKSRFDALGQETAYLMADQRRQTNIHCGLLWRRSDGEFLLDPGYALYEPLRLSRLFSLESATAEAGSAPGSAPAETWSGPHRVRIEPAPGIWRLWTGPTGALKHRFDFRREPVGEDEFFRHWEASYAWPMMEYPVLSRVSGELQHYLQKDNLFVKGRQGSEQRKLDAQGFLAAATGIFGIDRGLAEEALAGFRAAGKPWFRS